MYKFVYVRVCLVIMMYTFIQMHANWVYMVQVVVQPFLEISGTHKERWSI